MSVVHGRLFGVRCGVLLNPGSLWLGAHWSAYNRRLCVNLLPCVTCWFTLPGGTVPGKDQA